MKVDFRALVDEVRREEPGGDSRAYVTLYKFLEKRLAQHARYTNWTDESLRAEVGDEASRVELSSDDFDYLVESLAAHVDATKRPHPATVALLEWSRDERAVGPAVRLLERVRDADDESTVSCAIYALNILAVHQRRPEALSGIEEAAGRGRGEIGELAREVLATRSTGSGGEDNLPAS